MISFVWAHDIPMYAGRGGTETYTAGQVRELNSRGIATRIITIGLGKEDGRQFYPDIEFLDLPKAEDLSDLDDTLVYIALPLPVHTKKPAFAILHSPPSDILLHMKHAALAKAAAFSTLMVTSRFMRSLWADYLDVGLDKIHVVYPFADPHFAAVRRVKLKTKKNRVLFAGRLTPEKGIYTLLEALHQRILRDDGYSFTATTAGDETLNGTVIEQLLRRHPWIRVIGARRNPSAMARLMARYDIVVVPSNHTYWHEGFGMVSVEAQHAGCRVVASGADGLPETNCGELVLFKPGNPYSLAETIRKAVKAGPITKAQRKQASEHFTLAQSVDALLGVLAEGGPIETTR